MHAQILAYMFTLVETNKITVNLGPIPDNTMYVQEYVASLLKSAFSHLTDNQIKVFVTGLFTLNQEVSAFKEHLRDFLIQIRVSKNTKAVNPKPRQRFDNNNFCFHFNRK